MAGGRHEMAEENGIAHFLEHMAFKGTERRSALQIAEEIEDVGGYINAYTSREMTAYYARVLGQDVGLALDVISDIVLNPVFDPNEVEIERGVILQEIGQSLDTPDDVIFDWLQEVAYPEQPLGRTILGPSERVSSFQVDDFRQFTAQHYGPERIIVAAAGAIDHDQICRMVEKQFGHLLARAHPKLMPATFSSGERHETKALEQAHFTLAFEGPGFRDELLHTAQVFSTAFGGGMSSRLFQEAREKRGLCYTIFSQMGAHDDTGMTTIYAGTSEADVGDLAYLVVDELRKSAENMTEAEIARARAQIRASLVMGLESPTARVERLARMLSVWDQVPSIQDTVDRIDAVGVEDVRSFARGLCQSNAAMALYGPVGRAPSIEELKGRMAA
jgi:predicted Zn-dependent peptidase